MKGNEYLQVAIGRCPTSNPGTHHYLHEDFDFWMPEFLRDDFEEHKETKSVQDWVENRARFWGVLMEPMGWRPLSIERADKPLTYAVRRVDEAIERFASLVERPKAYVGRTCYDLGDEAPPGHAFDGTMLQQPYLQETAHLSSDRVVQVWLWDENALSFHRAWETNSGRMGAYSDSEATHRRRCRGNWVLVKELDVFDIERYDRWNQHLPMLPAAVDDSTTAIEAVPFIMSDGNTALSHVPKSELVSAKMHLALLAARLKGQMEKLDGSIDILRTELHAREKRLLLYELYLGRYSDIVDIALGEPAPDDVPVSIRQRVLYMDRELAYERRDLDFTMNNIGQFDDWLARPGRIDRILPEQKGIVCLRIKKEPALDTENKDHFHCFVMRNGQRIHRAWVPLNSMYDMLLPAADLFETMLEQQFESELRSGGHFRTTPEYEAWSEANERNEQRRRQEEFAAMGVLQEAWGERFIPGPIEAIGPEPERRYHGSDEPLAGDEREEREADARREALRRTAEHYREQAHTSFQAMLYVQGLFDRTHLFGELKGKVDLFGEASPHVRCIYDKSGLLLGDNTTAQEFQAFVQRIRTNVEKGDRVLTWARARRRSYRRDGPGWFEYQKWFVAEVVSRRGDAVSVIRPAGSRFDDSGWRKMVKITREHEHFMPIDLPDEAWRFAADRELSEAAAERIGNEQSGARNDMAMLLAALKEGGKASPHDEPEEGKSDIEDGYLPEDGWERIPKSKKRRGEKTVEGASSVPGSEDADSDDDEE